MSPTHHHQQQRRNSVNANSDTSTDGPWQCSTPLVRICTVGTINDVAGKDRRGKILYMSPTLDRGRMSVCRAEGGVAPEGLQTDILPRSRVGDRHSPCYAMMASEVRAASNRANLQ